MKKIVNLVMIMFCFILLTGFSSKYETNANIKEDGSLEYSVIVGYDKEYITSMMKISDSFNLPSEPTNTTEDNNTTTEDNNEVEPTPTDQNGDNSELDNPVAVDAPLYTDEQIEEYFYANIKNFDASKTEADKTNYAIEKYKDDNFYGIKFTTKINHIDVLSSDSESKFDISLIYKDEMLKPLLNEKLFRKQGSAYYVTFSFDPNNQLLDINSMISEEDRQNINEGLLTELNTLFETKKMDYKFILTLPNMAIDSNANSKSEDGKVLTWNLGSVQPTEIKAIFQLGATQAPIVDPSQNGPSLTLIFAIIGIAVILIIIVMLVAMIKKKKNASVEEQTNANVEAARNEENVVAPAPTGDVSAMVNSVGGTVIPEPQVEENIEVKTPSVETPATEPIINPMPGEPIASTTPITPQVEETNQNNQ